MQRHPLSTWLFPLLTFFLIVSSSSLLHATSAAPFAFTETQPDGSKIDLHMEGDEFFHYLRDSKGFTVLKDRKWFVYGKKDATGHLVPSGLRVGQSNPGKAGLSKNTLPDQAIRNARRKVMAKLQQVGGGGAEVPSVANPISGSLRNLVVLLRFSNHASRSLPSTGDIDILMNAVGGHPSLAPTGSVRDCYLENSYNQLSLDSTVFYWVTLPNTEAYYANGDSGLTSKTHEALKYALDVLDADPAIQFADFDQDNDGNIDAITFLHSGYGAEWGETSADGASYVDRIWSHKWAIFGGGGAWFSSDGVRVYEYHISPGIWGTSGSTIGRIGVICHETGHFLGLPDLYDGSGGSGIGSYGMMANSWGFDSSQKYPPHFCAWSKAALGWISPTVISTSGTYTANQTESAAEAFRIDLGYASGEYLLIENRQPVGFDAAMPQGGLCIFHIDEAAGDTTEGYPGQAGWPGNGNHYRVALLQADGTYDLERGSDRGDSTDPYRGGYVSQIGPDTTPDTNGYQSGNIIVTNNRIFNISSAGSTMTFDFEVVGAGQPPAAPSNLTAAATSDSQINLAWSDNSSDETTFRIRRSSDGVTFSEIGSTGADVASYADTNLPASATFTYQILASNASGSSDPSNSASAETDPPPPPPAVPTDLAATATSDTTIDLNWIDGSNNEDGFYVDRSLDSVVWQDAIATLPANASSYTDSQLAASTQHFYRVRAFNAQGSGTSNVASATTGSPPPFETAVSNSDWFVSGNVAGSHTATHASFINDGQRQTITEVQSGGKKSRRYSFLDHRWRFANVRGGIGVTLFVTGSAPANDEGDDFEIEFSTNGGTSWTAFSPPLIIANGSPQGTESLASFPSGTQGNIDLRIVDTNRAQGYRQFDSVSIDQLSIRTDIDPNDFPPEAPTSVTASVRSASEIDLTWSDNSSNEIGFAVYRSTDAINWIEVGNTVADSTSFSDSTASPGTTYTFRVGAFSSSFEAFSTESDEVTTPDGLSLAPLSGGKRKGKIYTDLVWSGGGSLDDVFIWRSVNGGAMENITATPTPNDSDYRDQTSFKGSWTLSYEIRSVDGTVVSNQQSITF